MNLAVRIPERGWKKWIDAVAAGAGTRALDVPASLAFEAPAFQADAGHLDLTPVHVHGLLAPGTAANLFNAGPGVRGELRTHIRSLLNRAEAAGIRTLDLDLGLDRIPESDIETGLMQRSEFLRSLLEYGPESGGGPALCVSVCFPLAYPGAKTWDWAANLIFEVMHPRCRLAVDVFPCELAPDFDIPAFVRDWYLQAALIRFHWRPGQGETLESANQAQWAAALRRHAFKGSVVFCPRPRHADSAPAVCSEIQSLCSLYKTPPV